MIQDTVTEALLLRKPGFVISVLVIIFIAFFIGDPSQGMMGHLMAPVIGDPAESGNFGRFATSLVLAPLKLLTVTAPGSQPNVLCS